MKDYLFIECDNDTSVVVELALHAKQRMVWLCAKYICHFGIGSYGADSFFDIADRRFSEPQDLREAHFLQGLGVDSKWKHSSDDLGLLKNPVGFRIVMQAFNAPHSRILIDAEENGIFFTGRSALDDVLANPAIVATACIDELAVMPPKFFFADKGPASAPAKDEPLVNKMHHRFAHCPDTDTEGTRQVVFARQRNAVAKVSLRNRSSDHLSHLQIDRP